jgi:hypothetical protein
MTNKPILVGLLSLLAAFLVWGYQALGTIMEKEEASQTLYLSHLVDTGSLESSAYLAFLATTPLYLLLAGLGVLFLIIGAIIQK